MMTDQQLLKTLISDVSELKAMISQLGPVSVKHTFAQEVAAIEAQGLDIGEYYHAKGKAAAKLERTKPKRKKKKLSAKNQNWLKSQF